MCLFQAHFEWIKKWDHYVPTCTFNLRTAVEIYHPVNSGSFKYLSQRNSKEAKMFFHWLLLLKQFPVFWGSISIQYNAMPPG